MWKVVTTWPTNSINRSIFAKHTTTFVFSRPFTDGHATSPIFKLGIFIHPCLLSQEPAYSLSQTARIRRIFERLLYARRQFVTPFSVLFSLGNAAKSPASIDEDNTAVPDLDTLAVGAAHSPH